MSSAQDFRALPARVLLSPTSVLLVVAGAGFHVLATPTLGGTAIRVGVTDLLLPIFLGIGLLSLRRISHAALLGTIRSHIWLWLAAISIWMLVSTVLGRSRTGEWFLWAILNKGVGWFVLVTYFTAGFWLGLRNTREQTLFLRTFFAVGWCASGFSLTLFFLDRSGLVPTDAYIRPQGFFDNPNAFGIAVAAQLIMQFVFAARDELFSTTIHRIGFAVGLLALLYAGSRSAWLGFAAGSLLLLALRHWPLRDIAFGLAFALILNTLAVWAPILVRNGMEVTDTGRAPATSPFIYVSRDNLLSDVGANNRIETTKVALRLWLEAPLTGTGLGGFLWEKRKDGSNNAGTGIHNSALWLLTETGLVGLVLFAGFFALVFRNLVVAAERTPLSMAATAMLFVLAAASIGTEVLYQRYGWFILGLGLAAAGRPEDRGTII